MLFWTDCCVMIIKIKRIIRSPCVQECQKRNMDLKWATVTGKQCGLHAWISAMLFEVVCLSVMMLYRCCTWQANSDASRAHLPLYVQAWLRSFPEWPAPA